jgi:ankyrin repeat protein
MQYPASTPFHQLLATRYDAAREQDAIELLTSAPELATLEWPDAETFIQGSTALHYAANDGKVRLVKKLIELGADVNAANACWYRSVLAWAANNARVEVIELLLAHGAKPDSLDALHAAAWGGPERGKGRERDYAATLKLLTGAGADVSDRRYCKNQTPLEVALESGNAAAIAFLRGDQNDG